MKRALSVAAVTALSLLLFLFIGYAQETEGARAIPELLEQELATMESAFGSLEAFMAELITEVKGNMGDIDTFNAKVDDLRDIVTAVSIEIKTAEGKIVGLREDVTALGDAQQELKVRIVALEAGLSELSAFAEELKARLDVQGSDLEGLRADFDELAADYGAFKEAYAAFKEAIYGDIDALRDSIYADFSMLEESLRNDVIELDERFSTQMLALEEALRGDTLALDERLTADVALLGETLGGEIAILGDALSTDIAFVNETLAGEIAVLGETLNADITWLKAQVGDLSDRVQALEDEDVGTFKKKVIELERSMAALAIRIDNNRAKLEGFDHAIASLADEMAATRDSVLQANQDLLAEYDLRLQALESVDLSSQLDTVYFISIVALLAGVGALIWGFLGNS